MDRRAELTARLAADLQAEGRALDALVAPLPAADWARLTPAPGWTIAHQIGHLAWTDDRAYRSATDPDGFLALLVEFAESADVLGAVNAGAARNALLPPAQLLEQWRAGRAAAGAALERAQGRLPWYGPPMSPTSMLSARLMETWAHGQDIAHVSIAARDFAYHVHGLNPPGEQFRVELTGPFGELWTWGGEDATQRVTGPALDFCLLATQRRHRADLAVLAEGAQARQWLGIIQAFAGPPGAGRRPGQFADADAA